MSDVAIRVEGLSKQYRIGQGRAPYKTIRESLSSAITSPLRRWRDRRPTTADGCLGPLSPVTGPRSVSIQSPVAGPRSPVPGPSQSSPPSPVPSPSSIVGPRSSVIGRPDTIWALKDVSFDVKQGEVVGIIGRNGAGKSTLLKILSRITKPTEGRAQIHGRVGSLLEVGTGFHPELTGRENIYLNGAILGMKKAEIDRKFDEIVAFAETEKFIDTPVKHYSSGMYVRLAFAVAAHLEPEILLVDEVLAVGDAAFQKKCLGKMGDVAKEGRTVLLVSHNMGAITRLCRRALLLDQGRIRLYAPSDEAVAQYLSLHTTGSAEFAVAHPSPAPGHPGFYLRAVRVKDSCGALAASVDIRHAFSMEIEYELRRPIHGLRVGFRLLTSEGVVVFSSTDRDQGGAGGADRILGIHRSRCEIPGGLLNKGHYTVSLGIDVPMVQSILFLDGVVSFFVEPTGGLVGAIPDNRLGVVCPMLPWTVDRL